MFGFTRFGATFGESSVRKASDLTICDFSTCASNRGAAQLYVQRSYH